MIAPSIDVSNVSLDDEFAPPILEAKYRIVKETRFSQINGRVITQHIVERIQYETQWQFIAAYESLEAAKVAIEEHKKCPEPVRNVLWQDGEEIK